MPRTAALAREYPVEVGPMVVKTLTHKLLPALAVAAAVISLWWALVIVTRNVIFPTPWQVLTGMWELVEDGSIWGHIGASLFQ